MTVVPAPATFRSMQRQPSPRLSDAAQQDRELSFDRNHSSSPNNYGEGEMAFACEPTPRKFRGGRTGNKSRIGTADLSDWLADVLRNKAAKDIADDAGCGIRTAENAKQGRNTLSGKHLANMQMNDPDFAAPWAEYVGLILPGDAEYAGAITRAANAAERRKAQRAAP